MVLMTEEQKMERIVSMQSDMADTVMAEAKKAMIDFGHVPSSIIGFNEEAQCVVSVPFGWNSPQERSTVLLMIKTLMMAHKVLLYTVCHEAWAKSYRPEEAKDIEKTHQWGDLEKEKDKDEVISVMVVSYRHVEARGCKIIRKDGKISFENMPKTNYTDGDLTRLIPWSKERDARRPA